ncbi:MAG TPA: PGPGW domain-containing protein [Candidatus Kapabacteria bacterium]|nr:PGPGW domain-containing protein [Candidatus Kapabacteria bacterium]
MTDNRTVNLTVGWSFIVLGIAGAILPILQGFLFFVVGLLFLSKEYVWAGKLLNWLRAFINKHFPKVGKVFEDAEKFLEKEIYLITSVKGHLAKRIWLVIAIFIVLGFGGWGLTLLVEWLWHLIVG